MASVRATGALGRFAAAKKSGGRLLPAQERFLQAEPRDPDRPVAVIHPSELSRPDFCPRAVAMRLLGMPVPPEELSYTLRNVFDEGHSIHAKHQSRWWRMRVLFGDWICLYCRHQWLAISPEQCPECGAPEGCLRYAEVPVASGAHRVAGHADGEVRDAQGNVLVELKSLSEGSIRKEAPRLLRENNFRATDERGREKTFLDIEAIWRNLHSPLGNAARQGQIYLACREVNARIMGWPPVDGIVFVYEYKPTQLTKEFFARSDPETQRELLEPALDVVWAVKRGIPPRCRKGRDGCAHCRPYEGAWARAGRTAQQGRAAVEPDGAQSAGAGRGDGSGPAAPAARPASRTARRPDRSVRPPADGSARPVDQLGWLLDRAARAGRG